MLTIIRRRRPVRRAQGMTEYIIIVGLIAILLIAAVNELSKKLQETYDGASKQLDAKVTKAITEVK